MRIRILAILCVVILTTALPAVAQDEAGTIDKSSIPAEATEANQFAPTGWKIEAQVPGDLNGDSLPDFALKLVENKPDKTSDGYPTERGRALVIVLATKDGKLRRAGVADSLLQCTRCGGAFYGVVEAPANVSIEKGVVVVEQDHGSRDVTDTTYRFRYDPATQRFILIGFDLSDVDRLTANAVTESTNYLTGIRITTRGKGNRDTKKRSVVQKKTVYLEDVSKENLEGAAYKRLHLD